MSKVTENLAEGPWVIRRLKKPNHVEFKTRVNGWSADQGRAWKFDTEQSARFILRGNAGEVVRLPEPERSPGGELVLSGGSAALGKTLTPAERADLADSEDLVQKGLDATREARASLLHIRDARLYREQFGTFEEYMLKRWGYSARHGHRLADWAMVEQNLLEGPKSKDQSPKSGVEAEVPLPRNESQARPLARLKPEEQREVWRETTLAKPAEKITARDVEATIEKRFSTKPGPEFAEVGQAIRKRILDAAQRAVVAIRALGDLVMGNSGHQSNCNFAVTRIEKIEAAIKNGDQVPEEMEVKWAIQDAAADLGGLMEMLKPSGNAVLLPHVTRALAEMKPLHDKFRLSNSRVDQCAAETWRSNEADKALAAHKSKVAEVAAHAKDAKGAKVFPKPNANGVYSDRDAETLRFSHGKLSASISLLQIGQDKWIESAEYEYKGSEVGAGSQRGPLIDRVTYPSRAFALFASASHAVEQAEQKDTYGWHTAAQKAAAKKMVEWAKDLKEQAMSQKAKPGPARSAGYVICREPVRGAIGVAQKPRYAGNPGGWTPDPSKVTPFANVLEATRRAGDSDHVMPLAKAQRRYQHAL